MKAKVFLWLFLAFLSVNLITLAKFGRNTRVLLNEILKNITSSSQNNVYHAMLRSQQRISLQYVLSTSRKTTKLGMARAP